MVFFAGQIRTGLFHFLTESSRGWLLFSDCYLHLSVILTRYSETEKQILYVNAYMWASLAAQSVKNLLVMLEMWIRSLGQEDPLEKKIATHSSSCLKNHMDRAAGWATVHGVTETWT